MYVLQVYLTSVCMIMAKKCDKLSHGVAMVEFKKTHATNELYLEVNPKLDIS